MERFRRIGLSAIIAVLAPAVTPALPAVTPSTQTGQDTTRAANALAGLFDAEELKKQKTGTDESGQFTQVDDMRFRVREVQPFGFVGSQWPNGILLYELAPDVRADAFKADQFLTACKRLTVDSGVGCFDRSVNTPSAKEHYVFVHNDPTNYSYVGRVGGQQTLGIADWHNQIIIAHELKHALGWTHEHQRPDRDRYVRIQMENVEAGKEHNFSIMVGAFTGHPYDFDSIMHYRPTAFSKNGQKTIQVLPPFAKEESKMGQRDHISIIDLAEVQGVYGDAGTEWCGMLRKPRNPPPQGCFFECARAADPRFGRWMLCGSCSGAEICP
jgi:hypothetical protein